MHSASNLNVEWFEGITQERERQEVALLARGSLLPLRSRIAWARAFPDIRTSLLVVRDATGSIGTLGVERHPSRALPGYHIVRVSRAGVTLPGGTARLAIDELTGAMRRDARVLRVHVECFSRDEAARERIGAVLAGQGYRRLAQVTNYEYTLATDLRARDDAGHLASLAQGVRQNIRALAKFPVELRPVQNVADAARMNALMTETLARTGARHQEQNYEAIIQLALTDPTRSRLVGVYRTDVAGADALIAFAWGVWHGDHVAYDIGASTRIPEFRNLSLGYPLLWDLITWARARGVEWFDFGGVSPGNSESEDDRVGRISDFKRRFEKSVVRVAEEWVLEPHPWRARLAAAVSRGARLLGRLRSISSTRHLPVARQPALRP